MVECRRGCDGSNSSLDRFWRALRRGCWAQRRRRSPTRAARRTPSAGILYLTTPTTTGSRTVRRRPTTRRFRYWTPTLGPSLRLLLRPEDQRLRPGPPPRGSPSPSRSWSYHALPSRQSEGDRHRSAGSAGELPSNAERRPVRSSADRRTHDTLALPPQGQREQGPSRAASARVLIARHFSSLTPVEATVIIAYRCSVRLKRPR